MDEKVEKVDTIEIILVKHQNKTTKNTLGGKKNSNMNL